MVSCPARTLNGLLVAALLCLSCVEAFLGRPSVRHLLIRRDLTSAKTVPVNTFEGDLISKEMVSSDISYVNVSPNVFPTDIPGDRMHGPHDERFASIFRQSAPYIALYRGSIMVIHIPGYVVKCRKVFDGIMDDIAILHLLGAKLVLVVGVREQLDDRIRELGQAPQYHGGMRVTDDKTLHLVKEESGSARYEIESALARGIRGIIKGGINVVSGNLFYSAKPLGVRDGVDFKLTGEVRKVEVENFNRRLDSGDVVLLTSLGTCPSGEAYHVPSESLAADTAAKLKASKLLFVTEGEGLVDTRTGKPVMSLRLSQAAALLDAWGINRSLYNYVESSEPCTSSMTAPQIFPVHAHPFNDTSDYAFVRYTPAPIVPEAGGVRSGDAMANYMRLMARCVYALSGGVRRAHLVSAYGGALLQELFTTDGSGTLICRDIYEGIRQASEEDVHSLQEMLKPLEEEGVLVRRSREDLLRDIAHCFVMVRDNATIACGMLKQYSDTHAEIACLVVHPAYRRAGRGETMLSYLEHRALLQGCTHVFALSTRTMQWFEERGFEGANPSTLPPSRKYNAARNSRVYTKRLGTRRELEAENLLWDVA